MAEVLGQRHYENEVFVSYAWSGESESIVNALEQAFADRGIRIVRDKKDLGYKGSIEEFEQRIGRGQCIILVISDKYLRSEHCMYELVEADENRNLRERIFPIVLAEAQIYKAVDRLNYVSYWDGQIKELNRAIKKITVMSNLSRIMSDLDKYTRIRASMDHLTDLLSDMNTLTPDMHAANGFSTLIAAVEQTFHADKLSSDDVGSSGSINRTLRDYLPAKKAFLDEFERKINQSSSNPGILIKAQNEIDDLIKMINLLTEDLKVRNDETRLSVSDLQRISELANLIRNLIKSATGLVATGENPVRQLTQISQHIPLLRNLVENVSLGLEQIGNSDS